MRRFAYFTRSGTILTLRRLRYVRKCLFYSLEQPLKKRILKELCSSVASGSIFPAYIWSFDPFLSHAGPCPDSFALKTRPTKVHGEGRSHRNLRHCMLTTMSQRPLTSNCYTFLFLKFFSHPTAGSFSLMFSFSGPCWSFLG